MNYGKKSMTFVKSENTNNNMRPEVKAEVESGERLGKGIFYPFCFAGQSWLLKLNLSLNLNLVFFAGKTG